MGCIQDMYAHIYHVKSLVLLSVSVRTLYVMFAGIFFMNEQFSLLVFGNCVYCQRTDNVYTALATRSNISVVVYISHLLVIF